MYVCTILHFACRSLLTENKGKKMPQVWDYTLHLLFSGCETAMLYIELHQENMNQVREGQRMKRNCKNNNSYTTKVFTPKMSHAQTLIGNMKFLWVYNQGA